MAIDIKKRLRRERIRTYLARDESGFKSDLLRFARTYYSDVIQDFSEASVGGLLLDLAAIIGDNISFYQDHQFNELNYELAIETDNVLNHIRQSGVKISGASPSVVDISFFISIRSEITDGEYQPKRSALPIILKNTTVESNDGVVFNLTDDIDFAEVDSSGNLKATIVISSTNADGSPSKYTLSRTGFCVSGVESSESFVIQNVHEPFRELTMSSEDITDIVEVRDEEGNSYYEVESLTQDVVFKGVLNLSDDNDLVKKNLEIIPAPYRFIKNFDINTRLTTLQFGGGNALSIDDDIVPDPSELSLPLFGKSTFSRFSIDPNSLLDSHTLGVAPINTTIVVDYRSGGGLPHNVSANSITLIDRLQMEFRNRPTPDDADLTRRSIEANNEKAAAGGEDTPSLEELRAQIPAARQMQSRIVSREDLLARIYTLPSEFGRVFRVGIRQDSNSPLSSQLYVISRDIEENLSLTPDSLKRNLKTYLNEFRLISDALDVLDAQIINFSIQFEIMTHPSSNKNLVIQSVISRLGQIFTERHFQIDQPIILDDIKNVILNTDGVISSLNLKLTTLTGVSEERSYSDMNYNLKTNTFRGIVVGPPGSIFELKYPDNDIIGSAV